MSIFEALGEAAVRYLISVLLVPSAGRVASGASVAHIYVLLHHVVLKADEPNE